MNNGMGGNVANNMDPIANVNIFRWYRAAADEYAAKPTKMVSIKNKQPQQTILQIILIRMFQDSAIQNKTVARFNEVKIFDQVYRDFGFYSPFLQQKCYFI